VKHERARYAIPVDEAALLLPLPPPPRLSQERFWAADREGRSDPYT